MGVKERAIIKKKKYIYIYIYIKENVMIIFPFPGNVSSGWVTNSLCSFA